MQINHLVYLSLLLCLAFSFHNPGVVIQIPSNYSLPVVRPQLPQHIPSILLQKLQLTNIQLRQINYNWKLVGDKFIILLIRTVVSFDWKYGHDGGLGTFQEQYSDLVVQWSLNMDKDARFKIQIESAKITNQDKRHSIKVHLGGNVPETIVIIVTNEILNNAKAAFRGAIKSAIGKAVQAFTEPLRKDLKLICVQKQKDGEQCIYLNTTLVSKPLIADGIQYIQVNAAPYRIGHSSSYLDPTQGLIKFNSTVLDVQIHQKLFSQLIKNYLQINPITQMLNMTSVSQILNMNTQTLAMLFPKMKNYVDIRPVLANITIDSVSTVAQPPYIVAKAKAGGKIFTQLINERVPVFQQYLNKISGEISIYVQPMTSKSQAGAFIAKIVLDSLDFDFEDIANSVVNPPQITKHMKTFMRFAEQGANGVLYTKKADLQLAGLQICPKLNVLSNSINAEIAFIDAKSEEIKAI